MSYNNSDIKNMLKAMQVVTQGYDISKLVDLYTSESDAPEATSEYTIKLEHLDFMRNHIIGGKLKITEENAEALLEQDPNCFQCITVEFIDINDKDYFDEENVDG